MTLEPNARLRVPPELTVRCRSGTEFDLALGGNHLTGGPHTLSILSAFRSPETLANAIHRLKSQLTGKHDWIELTAEILRFHRAGMLLDERAAIESATLDATGRGFGSAPVHVAMLNDRERTRSYLAAIRQTVRPGDVVVDLGTGSGLLAVAAAQAGAKRVYAIEATAIARVAERVFAANRVSDRITLIEGYSTQIRLPERADLLVAEVIGSDPLAERILECTSDAVRRFLKPDARLIPSRLDVMAVPIEVPDEVRERSIVSNATLEHWRASYGIDFSPLQALAGQAPISFFESALAAAGWARLAEPGVLSQFDLTRSSPTTAPMSASFDVLEDGRIDGVLIWFVARLASAVSLSTDPRTPRPDNHWMHPVYLLPNPMPVRRGDRVRVSLENRDARSLKVAYE